MADAELVIFTNDLVVGRQHTAWQIRKSWGRFTLRTHWDTSHTKHDATASI